jgi:hypothetical protein
LSQEPAKCPVRYRGHRWQQFQAHRTLKEKYSCALIWTMSVNDKHDYKETTNMIIKAQKSRFNSWKLNGQCHL